MPPDVNPGRFDVDKGIEQGHDHLKKDQNVLGVLTVEGARSVQGTDWLLTTVNRQMSTGQDLGWTFMDWQEVIK